MKRPRFNRNAVCSSANYEASHKAHLEVLKSNHSTFSNIAVSNFGVACKAAPKLFNIPAVQYKTVRVFGKETKVTLAEYEEHYKHLGF